MEPWVIVVIAVSALLVIGLGVLLYFTVFAHMRYRKQVRELSRRLNISTLCFSGRIANTSNASRISR